MIVGVPAEVKEQEYRVGMVPGGVGRLVRSGHEVLVERGAGKGSGVPDDEYAREGAELVARSEVWNRSDLIVKVKEPQPEEWAFVRNEQILFTFFHFAASRELTRAMMEAGAVCIAYETVKNASGHHPILTPMSEIAGRLSVQRGAGFLEKTGGGKGILMGGVPGVHSAHVLILGAGVVGASAAKVANGMEARVTVMDVDLDRLRYLEDVFPANVSTLYSSPTNLREMLRQADLVIGAAHRTGARAPYLLRKEDLACLREGSVLVDVAIDQGGCFETSRPTTHSDPVFVVDGILHYCVANMPGAVPRTSTFALTNATLPYVAALADRGFPDALRRDPALREGADIVSGKITHPAVAESMGLEWTPVDQFLR